MDNKTYIAKIMQMNLDQLFEEVMDFPEYLTDHYYYEIGAAIRKRYRELHERD